MPELARIALDLRSLLNAEPHMLAVTRTGPGSSSWPWACLLVAVVGRILAVARTGPGSSSWPWACLLVAVVGRIPRATRILITALGASAEHIDFVSRHGATVFHGDASRLGLLRATRVDCAPLFVFPFDDANLRATGTEARRKLRTWFEHDANP